MTSEPANLREWKQLGNSGATGRLFTCGRPGRATYGRERVRVPDEVIDRWVEALPQAEVLHIVSLLGRKKDDYSEFGYYPFCSSEEAGRRPTFQEWLDARYQRRIVVHEYPTVDAQGIPSDILNAAAQDVKNLLDVGSTVVVVDSAGAERTDRVCKKAGYSPVNSPDPTSRHESTPKP